MHITLRQLEIFEAVARHASITRAAAELHLTQPAVSMQVKQLEEQIGLALVEQIGRRLQLTPAGTELREHGRRVGEQLADLQAAMDALRGLERGVLRISVVSTANYYLPPLLARYGQEHPGVRVQLQVGNRDAVLEALADNQADLAITGQPPETAEVLAEDFMDNPLVVIASPQHPLAQRARVPLAALADQTLLVREPGSGTRAAMERHFAAHGLAWHAGSELGTNEAIKQAVRAGLGLGVVSAQTIELEVETARLAVLKVDSFPIVRRWFVVQRARKRLAPAATAFRALLLQQEAPRLRRRSSTRTAMAEAATKQS
jgi:DNA-binding transcriptional LysR family regulator